MLGAAARRALLPAALVLAAASACGPGPEPPPAATWPLALEVPAVLGYAALEIEPIVLADVLEGALGWRPKGLARGRPIGVLALDATVLGGELGFVLPTDDASALRRSLEASTAFERLDDDRWRFSLPAVHPLVQAMGVARRLAGSGQGVDLMEMLAALGESPAFEREIRLVQHDDHVLVVPSYEGGVVARKALAEIGGLSRRRGTGGAGAAGRPEAAVDLAAGSGRRDVVVTVDVARLVTTFHEEFAALEAQLQAVLLGTRTAGMAAMLSRLADQDGPAGGGLPALPVPGPLVWTVLDMLAVRDVEALQLGLSGVDVEGLLSRAPGLGAGGDREPVAPKAIDLRLRYHEGTSLLALLETMRPVGAVEGGLALAADPEAFAPALAAWMRPVAEWVKGQGPPAERYLDELRELLAPWGGLAVLGPHENGAVLIATTRPGENFDGERLSAWCATLAAEAGLEPDDGVLGRLLSGEQTTSWRSGELHVTSAGTEDPVVVEHLRAQVDTLRGAAPARGPVVRLEGLGGALRWQPDDGDLLVQLVLPDLVRGSGPDR